MTPGFSKILWMRRYNFKNSSCMALYSWVLNMFPVFLMKSEMEDQLTSSLSFNEECKAMMSSLVAKVDGIEDTSSAEKWKKLACQTQPKQPQKMTRTLPSQLARKGSTASMTPECSPYPNSYWSLVLSFWHAGFSSKKSQWNKPTLPFVGHV